MTFKNITMLFDETGTPAISNDQRTDWFLGVGVLYEQSDEESVFSKCEDGFGLTNSQPLKNFRISNSRSVTIAKLLADLPLMICVSSVNTMNPALRQTIVDYESFGAKTRLKFRRARKRPIPQIIHSQVLDHCLFNLITLYFESGGEDAAFSIFIDNWSVPRMDKDISIQYRAESLKSKIARLCAEFHGGSPIDIHPLVLLSRDSKRKKFIDVAASVLSRAYLKVNNDKYSREPMDILIEAGKLSVSEATEYSVNIMQAVMKSASGNC